MPHITDIYNKNEDSHSLLHRTQSCFVEQNETFDQEFIPFGLS